MMYYKWMMAKCRIQKRAEELKEKCFTSKSEGIDGILVTVGLCIIALVLCVVMKTELSEFISGIVTNMTTKATSMLELTGK